MHAAEGLPVALGACPHWFAPPSVHRVVQKESAAPLDAPVLREMHPPLQSFVDAVESQAAPVPSLPLIVSVQSPVFGSHLREPQS